MYAFSVYYNNPLFVSIKSNPLFEDEDEEYFDCEVAFHVAEIVN